jgi:hypothetical protein
MTSATLFADSEIELTQEELHEPQKSTIDFTAQLLSLKKPKKTKEKVNPFEMQIAEIDSDSSEKKEEPISSIDQNSSLDNLEKTFKACIDDAIKANNKDQLDQYLKDGLIDKDQMLECLKKMVHQTKGPKIIDSFEKLYAFSTKEKIALESILSNEDLETIFYWSLEKRNTQAFKKALEISTDLNQATLQKLQHKINENCNSPFKNLEPRKKACQEYNDLMKYILASSK